MIRDRSSQTRKSKDEFEQRGRTPEREPIGEDSTMMRQLMGFDTFDTTKGKHVEGTDASGVKKKKKAKFRQYMNREKGFNRPLSPEAKKRNVKKE
jgi:U4/U6.U5 tri-snRNP-associated protein 3